MGQPADAYSCRYIVDGVSDGKALRPPPVVEEVDFLAAEGWRPALSAVGLDVLAAVNIGMIEGHSYPLLLGRYIGIMDLEGAKKLDVLESMSCG